MRIVDEAFLVAQGRKYADSAGQLDEWRKIVKAARWKSLVDVRRAYPATDMVKVKSGRPVLVFNIRRNEYRLIVAAHFNRQTVYTLLFMTHAEYSKDAMERDIMRVTQNNIEFRQLPKDYAGLCRILTPRPIHDKAELQNVLEITRAMASHDLNADQMDYFDILCRMIEDYEKDRVPRPKVSGLEALRHLLEANGMKAADLARLLGVHRTLGAMILRGERKLTIKHVQTLAQRFAVSPDLFVT